MAGILRVLLVGVLFVGACASADLEPTEERASADTRGELSDALAEPLPEAESSGDGADGPSCDDAVSCLEDRIVMVAGGSFAINGLIVDDEHVVTTLDGVSPYGSASVWGGHADDALGRTRVMRVVGIDRDLGLALLGGFRVADVQPLARAHRTPARAQLVQRSWSKAGDDTTVGAARITVGRANGPDGVRPLRDIDFAAASGAVVADDSGRFVGLVQRDGELLIEAIDVLRSVAEMRASPGDGGLIAFEGGSSTAMERRQPTRVEGDAQSFTTLAVSPAFGITNVSIDTDDPDRVRFAILSDADELIGRSHEDVEVPLYETEVDVPLLTREDNGWELELEYSTPFRVLAWTAGADAATLSIDGVVESIDRATPRPIAANALTAGSLDPFAPVDTFLLDLEAGDRVRLDIESPVWLVLTSIAPEGQHPEADASSVVGDLHGVGIDEHARYTAPHTGRYVVTVAGWITVPLDYELIARVG